MKTIVSLVIALLCASSVSAQWITNPGTNTTLARRNASTLSTWANASENTTVQEWRCVGNGTSGNVYANASSMLWIVPYNGSVIGLWADNGSVRWINASNGDTSMRGPVRSATGRIYTAINTQVRVWDLTMTLNNITLLSAGTTRGAGIIDAEGHFIIAGGGTNGVRVFWPNMTLRYSGFAASAQMRGPQLRRDGMLLLSLEGNMINISYANLTSINTTETPGSAFHYIESNTSGWMWVPTLNGRMVLMNSTGTIMASTVEVNGTGSGALLWNDTIYHAVAGQLRAYYSANLTSKWNATVLNVQYGRPAAAADGTVYYGNGSGAMFAFYPNGTQKWNTSAPGVDGAYNTSIVLDSRGNIYAVTSNTWLTSFWPNGTLRWVTQIHGGTNTSELGLWDVDDTITNLTVWVCNTSCALINFTNATGGTSSNITWNFTTSGMDCNRNHSIYVTAQARATRWNSTVRNVTIIPISLNATYVEQMRCNDDNYSFDVQLNGTGALASLTFRVPYKNETAKYAFYNSSSWFNYSSTKNATSWAEMTLKGATWTDNQNFSFTLGVQFEPTKPSNLPAAVAGGAIGTLIVVYAIRRRSRT